MPNPAIPRWTPIWADKATHASLYLVFGWLVARAFRQTPIKAVTLSTILLIGLVGAFDEWHQLFIAGRSADVADWMADVCGGVAGCFLAWAYQRRELRS